MSQIQKVDAHRSPEEGLLIYDGAKAILDAQRKRKMKFWKERNGRECIVVSRHRGAVIVEIPSLAELVICQVKDLRPATRS
jgi:hypothetical protein